jgi:ABC-type multidrug transport system fused ATPase/permease subunit
VFRYFKRPIRQSGHSAQQNLASVHGNLVEKFLGMEVVQGFTAEERENEAFVDAIDGSRQAQLVSKRLHVLQKIVADLLIGVGTVALLGFGGYQVMHEGASRMQPGTFIAFFGFVGMLYPTVAELMGSLSKLVRVGASLDRIQEILAGDAAERAHADPFRGPVRGHLNFFWVSVQASAGRDVLKDVTLEIPAGTFCVITGPSGSGKSTLVNLVPRFVRPSHGRILLDAMDLSTADVKHLRDSIGIAFQECFLFNATVLDNLRYANPDATRAQIDKAAVLTGADRLVGRLPDGYQTLLGEGGWSLSRGEKQLLALTRALLKQPRILILDEATSSIDVGTEQQLIPRIQRFMQGRTTLLVTHRPELFDHADMVVVLNEGRVIYQGAPAELPPDTLESLGISTPLVVPPILTEAVSTTAPER